MCITFSVKHVCGHEHIRHTVKCLQTIRCQLDLAEGFVTDSANADGRLQCLCEADTPREYIKPGICEQCKKTGLVGNFFEQNPTIEYEVLRQWQAHKRISKTRKADVEHDIDWDAASTITSQAYSSASSVETNSPGTPVSRKEPSSLMVANPEDSYHRTDPELLPPAAFNLNDRLDPTKETLEQDVATAVQEKERPIVRCEEAEVVEETYDLRYRMKKLSDRVQSLMPAARQEISTRSKGGNYARSPVAPGRPDFEIRTRDGRDFPNLCSDFVLRQPSLDEF